MCLFCAAPTSLLAPVNAREAFFKPWHIKLLAHAGNNGLPVLLSCVDPVIASLDGPSRANTDIVGVREDDTEGDGASFSGQIDPVLSLRRVEITSIYNEPSLFALTLFQAPYSSIDCLLSIFQFVLANSRPSICLTDDLQGKG